MDMFPSQEDVKKSKILYFFVIIGTFVATTTFWFLIFSVFITDQKNTEIKGLERQLSGEKEKKDEKNEILKSRIGLLQDQIAKQEKAIDNFDEKITIIENDKTACNDKLKTFYQERDLLKETLASQSAKAKMLEKKLLENKENYSSKVQKQNNNETNGTLKYYFDDQQRNK